MTNRSVSCICENVGKTAAKAICTSYGDGPGTFSVPLSTSPGVTNPALATHWAMSGDIPAAEVSALEVSLDPKVWVFDLSATQTFDTHLTMTTPRLYRIFEAI